MNGWNHFKGKKWQEGVDVRNFIQLNYIPYEGDHTFLSTSTERTNQLMNQLNDLFECERKKGGVLDIELGGATSIKDHFKPGYLNKDQELIVGLQTDSPLKRAINPFGGLRMAKTAVEAYGYEFPKIIEEEFKYRTTHNDGVFAVYSEEMKLARKVGLITGLPDAYGRGRIIGDYRRVALYGIDFLIEEKLKDKKFYSSKPMSESNIRLIEEIAKQIDGLHSLKSMAETYGFNLSFPATNAQQAIQWTYFAYLGAIKSQNGAAMSLGRISTFFDIYLQRDIELGILDEEKAQELIDDFVMKLRMARHLRTPEYNELFAGDPMWITESVGGMGIDGRTLVTKTSFRFLNTLYTLGASPEPNITILYSKYLPVGFKKYCAQVSIETDAIQYENDDLMRVEYGDDYGIACCVSAMKIGKQMQLFGARCNLPKLLLMSINSGRDEINGIQVGPKEDLIKCDILDYDKIIARFTRYMKWIAALYVNTMNVIHYMHDKHAYERVEMSLHDTNVERFMAFGVAGLSVVADSLSAIKYAKVKPIKDETGLVYDFEIEGDYPKFGNDDDRVDNIASIVVESFIEELKNTPTYRNALHTLSVLTITSNVMYGKKTGNTPDGRRKGEPFAPGANPLHNREKEGAIASLNSVAKISYACCKDGVSNTFSIVSNTLGKNLQERIENLVTILNGYFSQEAHHINVNVLEREKLIAAMNNPALYPNLTIRVSGYAVNFNKLSHAHQQEVISRTFHEKM